MSMRLLFALTVGALSSASAAAEVLIGSAGPITGPMAWHGEQHQRGMAMAVAELNGAGGVLGQPVEVISADDYCDAEQAVAAAKKLLAAGAVFVVGHNCSGAAIPASRVYEDAGVVMISNTATNPKLTDQGFHRIFRMVARDTRQAEMAARYLADEQHRGRVIAIVHDGQAYGRGLAEATRAELNQRHAGVTTFEQITPGQGDYGEVLAVLVAAGVDLLFYGGYQPEAALLIRQARDRGYDLQMVGSDALCSPSTSGTSPGRRPWACGSSRWPIRAPTQQRCRSSRNLSQKVTTQKV